MPVLTPLRAFYLAADMLVIAVDLWLLGSTILAGSCLITVYLLGMQTGRYWKREIAQ